MPFLTFPLSCFVGLAVGGVEVTVAGYARQPMLLEYATDGVTLSNLYTAQWQYARQTWGTIDTVLVFDSVTGGNLLVSLPAATPLLIAQYDEARIPADGLVCVYNTTNRPFGRFAYGTQGYGTDRMFAGTGTVPTFYGQQAFGVGLYGVLETGVTVERTFQQQDACTPGTWAPFNLNALAA